MANANGFKRQMQRCSTGRDGDGLGRSNVLRETTFEFECPRAHGKPARTDHIASSLGLFFAHCGDMKGYGENFIFDAHFLITTR